jgi:hypothetical protein
VDVRGVPVLSLPIKMSNLFIRDPKLLALKLKVTLAVVE